MSDATYDADFVLWSEHQADALRRLRRGERTNDVDWDNLIEEVEDLGRSETRSTTSLLGRALDHLLKAAAWPESRETGHWRAEATVFLRDAANAFAPSMAQRIDVARVYRGALRTIAELGEIDGQAPRPLASDCPFSLTEMLACDFDVGAAAKAFRADR